ncbi:MAG: leucine-rich repeat domain-containing protein [Clostridia bacterium]|nr:leucine-rich repeat domain-containing protein [Clostridia bacterium]
MQKDTIISKGKYSFSKPDEAISVKQFFFVKDENGQKKLLLRLHNNKKSTCTKIAFKISFFDARGRCLGKERIESENICIEGKSSYAFGEAIKVSEKCVSFKFALEYALYGSYKFTKESVEYVEPVPVMAEAGYHMENERVIKERRVKSSWLVAIIALMALCALAIVVGKQLFKFKDENNKFSLEGLEYEFVSEEKENGKVVITGCSDMYSNLLIPKEIEGNTVVGIRDGAFKDNSRIESIRIDGVNIGAYTFSNCVSLKSVEIISVDTIGDNAFDGCINLNSVSIMAGDKNVLNIGHSAFANCTSLASVSIDQFARYYDGCAIFRNDYNLTSLYLKNFAYTIENYNEYAYETRVADMIISDSFLYGNEIGLKNLKIGYTDSICEGFCSGLPMLESFELSESEITEIGDNAFKNCTSLRNVTFKNPITAIGNSAFELTALESFNASSLVSVGNRAFYGCQGLNSFDLSINNTLEAIGSEAFYQCVALSQISIPKSVKTIGREAFRNTSLTSLTIESDKIEVGAGIIMECEGISSLTLSDIPEGYIAYMFGGEASKNDESIPEALESVTITGNNKVLGGYAFANAHRLKNVILPETIEEIGSMAFYRCYELSEVNLTENLKSIGEYAFAETSIKEFTIPEEMTIIPKGLFHMCLSLEKVTTGDKLDAVCESAFYQCESLKSIDLHNVTQIDDNAFAYSGLREFTLPATVNYVGESILSGCNSLKEITISLNSGLCVNDYFSDVSYYNDIPDTLRKITVNNGEVIDQYAFDGCTYVEEIVLENGVKTIDADFKSCTQLRKLTIPETAEYFRSGSTYYCKKLYEICNLSSNVHFNLGIGDAINTLHIANSLEECAPIVEAQGYKYAKYGDSWYLIGWDDTFTELNPMATFTYRAVELESETAEEVNSWSVPNSLFVGYDNIVKVTLPKSLASLGKNAFEGCYSLTEVIIDKEAPLTIINNSTFRNCMLLNKVVLPDSVVKIDILAFSDCERLATVDMPKSLAVIENDAFFYCSSLESIVLYENVSSIASGAFSSCDSLYDVYNLSSIEIVEGTYDLDGVARGAFIHTSLSDEKSIEVVMPGIGYFRKSGNNWILQVLLSDVTKLDTNELKYAGATIENLRILEGAGLECDYIESIIIGNNVWQIQDSAFYGNYYLRTVDMSQNNRITEICPSAFKNCKRLVELTLPSSLKIIGEGAFENCEKLLSIRLPESLEQIDNVAFRGCAELYEVINNSSNISISMGTQNGYVAAYAYGVFNSDEEGFERYEQNGCYFIICNDVYYLHHYTGGESDMVIVPNTEGEMIILPDAFHTSNLTKLVLPTSVAEINTRYSQEYYIEDIYYEGTSSEWASIGYYSDARIYYYSECVHNDSQWTYVNNAPTTQPSELTWSVTTEPTCQKKGIETGTCKVEGCEYYETKEIDTTDHKLVNDKCEYCQKTIIAVNSTNMETYPTIFKVEYDGFTFDQNGIAMSQNETAGIGSTFTITANQRLKISFDYTVSASYNDHLYIYNNGMIIDYISGEKTSSMTIILEAGDTISASFDKASSFNVSNNCGYIANIEITVE